MRSPLSDIQAKLLSHCCVDLETVFDSRSNKPELPLITLSGLNNMLWGIPKRKMTIIGARTSNGKSNMAINIAYDIASQGKTTLFISLEMTKEDIAERIFCYQNKVDNQKLMRKQIDFLKEWVEFKKHVEKIPLIISDMIGKNAVEIDEFLTNLDNKPELVIIDHIQEIYKLDRDKKDTIDKYLNHMRELAVRHNFAIVICSQINRIGQEAENKEPQLHHLKGSGAIEEIADIALLLHWPYHYKQTNNKNLFKINIAKNRNGLTGYLELKYIPEYCRFENADQKVTPMVIKQPTQEVAWDE